jgi:effector-binding domain-containing protein
MASELLTIGGMARLSGLTVKALRHYDETGVLKPSQVDVHTGYRYYATDQVVAAVAVRRLRELDLPLASIVRALIGGSSARDVLIGHLAELRRRAVDATRMIAELEQLLSTEEDVMTAANKPTIRFGFEVKELSDRLVVSIARKIASEKIPKFIPEAYSAITDYLRRQGVEVIGPPFYVCPYPDAEGKVDGEAGVYVETRVAGEGDIVCRTLEGGRVASTLYKGDYKNLDTAYRALEEWMTREGHEKAGPPRELYLNDPDNLPPEEWLTEVLWPVA